MGGRAIWRSILAAAALVVAVAAVADTYDQRTLLRVYPSGAEEVDLLYACRMDVESRLGDTYRVLARPEEIALLVDRGVVFEILYEEMAEDRRLWAEADQATRAAEAAGPMGLGRAPTFYYTASTFNLSNPGTTTLMKHLLDLATAHPEICRLYDLGDSSSGNYDILAIKVTKNPDLLEAEPKIRIYGNIHGDEKGGLMVACEALDWILENYPANAQARQLVDESEMWFIPMGNPDGNASNSRYNGNGVDLNRNFWGPEGHSDGTAPFSEPETQAIRDLTEVSDAHHPEKRFAASLSFHGGAACFNSIWNYTYDRPPDEPLFWSARTPGSGCSDENGCLTLEPEGFAQAYKDACTTSGFWYTNGADWYRTWGDTNDWAYGMWGDLDTTLEVTVSKTPPANTIPTFVAEHRQATINYMLKTFQGIHGVMSDQVSGAKLDGTVEVVATSPAPHTYRAVHTDPVAGDFHRPLIPGTYTVTCKAPGYTDTVVSGVVVTADAKTTCDCPMAGIAALGVTDSTATDLCSGTGSGGDGVVDPGEDVVLSVTLTNTGSLPATSVVGTLSTTAPGVTVLDGSATFADVPGLGTGGSLAPHFTIRVDPSVACGTALPFSLHLVSTQGSWDDTLSLTVGVVTPGGGTLWSQGFEGMSFPPGGWSQVDVGGTSGSWVKSLGTAHPAGGGVHGGVALAYFNAYDASAGASTRLFPTAATTIPGEATSVTLSFWMYHDTGFPSSNDRVQPQISTDGGTTWTGVGPAISRYDGTTGWTRHAVGLPLAAGAAAQVGLLGISAYGNDCHVDDLSLEYTAPGGCTAHACTPALLPPGETAPGDQLSTAQTWGTDKSTHGWPANGQATGYKVVRGTPGQLPALLTGAEDSCLRWSGAGLSLSAPEEPPGGSFFWYLVIGTNGAGDGQAGSATAGPRSVQSSGSCP